MGSLIVTIALVLFTIGFGRMPFMDLPLALALMSFGGGLLKAGFATATERSWCCCGVKAGR
jgi:hypothetical protein